MIPVDDEDARAFQLQTPDPIEARLQSVAGLWRLYASSYRLQAGLFGTSTRQYVHLQRQQERPGAYAQADGEIGVVRPRAAAAPDAQRRAELRRQDELLWRFAELIAAHRKRAVFFQIGSEAGGATGDVDVADFNAAFDPFAEIVRVTVPPAMLFDRRHLTAQGARRVGEALTP
jgi:hypothetical protein